MAAERPDSALKAAVESMFRIHATESPPDAKGHRTIWHRGAKNAELVSTADHDGKLTQQDFFLYDDVLLWKKGTPARTGTARHAEDAQDYSSQSVAFDHDFDARRNRLERMSRSLQGFSGTDKYILHLRSVVDAELQGMSELDDEPVTRSGEVLRREEVEKFARGLAAKKKGGTKSALVFGIAAVIAAVALFLLTK